MCVCTRQYGVVEARSAVVQDWHLQDSAAVPTQILFAAVHDVGCSVARFPFTPLLLLLSCHLISGLLVPVEFHCHSVGLLVTSVYCGKMADLVEMPFGMQGACRWMNHVWCWPVRRQTSNYLPSQGHRIFVTGTKLYCLGQRHICRNLAAEQPRVKPAT